MHEACYFGHARSARALCRWLPSSIHAKDSSGCAPLLALFLFNDTAPGWKHPGSLREGPDGASRAPIPSDQAASECLEELLAHGARPQGGELCRAAWLGLERCARILCSLQNGHCDYPDEHFPTWCRERGWIANRPSGMAEAVACALDGGFPSCALAIAMVCPSSSDEAHASAFASSGHFNEARALAYARPGCSQACLAALFSHNDPPSEADGILSLDLLAHSLFNFGADPHAAPASGGLTPFEHAARLARHDLIALCAGRCKLSPEQATRAASLVCIGERHGAAHARTSKALAEIEEFLLNDTLRRKALSVQEPRRL